MITTKNSFAITTALLLFQCFSGNALAANTEQHSLTVSEAYRAVPHRRTEYSETKSSQASSISRYLKVLFKATDLALIERINGLNGAYNKIRYQNRIAAFGAIVPPEEAKEIQHLIVAAISEQQRYFESNKQERRLVQSSHKKLIQAYYKLKRIYPDVSRNEQAYFDHLCALDFI